MKIKYLYIFYLALSLFVSTVQGQVYMTQTGETSFFSETPIENISAINKNVAAAINTTSNDIAIRIQNVNFKFPNKLMEEHFNENYMESVKYPLATFKGKIQEKINFLKEGMFDISAKGIIEIHGVKKEIILPGKIIITKNQLILTCDFTIKLADFKIEIPKIIIAKIAESVAVKNKFALSKN
jgi:polyisoprenoid-binding protein YceI